MTDLRNSALEALVKAETWAQRNPDAGKAAGVLFEGVLRGFVGGWATKRLVNALTPLNLSAKQGRGIYMGVCYLSFAVGHNYQFGCSKAIKDAALLDDLRN